MATKFPHVEVIGIDLAPAILDEHVIPDNCRFELGDVNQGLPRFYDQIDLIHVRAICSGVSPRRRLPIHLVISSQLSITPFKMQSCLKRLLTSDNKLRGDCRRARQVPKAGGYAHPGRGRL